MIYGFCIDLASWWENNAQKSKKNRYPGNFWANYGIW